MYMYKPIKEKALQKN